MASRISSGSGRSLDSREAVVVGGGQAGLALGYFLARQESEFVILEATDESAASWRVRWDSLKLFTSARYDSLPGLTFPGEGANYPGRDEVLAYLTRYARHFELPLELNSRVRSLRQVDSSFELEFDGR